MTLNDSAGVKLKSGDLDGAELDLLSALEYSGQDPRLRKNLGAIYYEKGVRAVRASNFYDAQKYLTSSLGIDPGNEKYRKAFAGAVSLEADSRAKIGQNEDALRLYKKAAVYDEKNISAWLQAAHYAWSTQHLDLGREYLDRAKALDPSDKNVLILEEKLKKNFNESESGGRASLHFILSAASTEASEKTSDSVLRELEGVYNEVSYKLNYFPQNKISVVFYPVAEFHDHWNLPKRVSGFYDGKLRIPYANEGTPFETLKPMIRHELAHAFVSSMTRKPIPRWMNEGLAQWVEGKKMDIQAKDAFLSYQFTKRVPDITQLDTVLSAQQNPFNNKEMTLSYMKAFSLVEYLIEENGVWSFVQFAQNQDTAVSQEELFKKYFHANLQQIEERWLRWLERKRSHVVIN